MLWCTIPRPYKHANPPFNTHTTHYTISLAGYPRLAQALTLTTFKAHTNTKMLYLLRGATNSVYGFNYNFVHYMSCLLARLLLMQKAQTMTAECQNVFKDVHQRRLLTFMFDEIYLEKDVHWDLSSCLGKKVISDMRKLRHSRSENFDMCNTDIQYYHHTFE